MALTLNETRRALADVLDEREALAKKVSDEGRAYTAEEEALDDELKGKAEAFERTIARMEEVRAAGAKRVEPVKEASHVVTIVRNEGEDENGDPKVFSSFGEQLRAIALAEMDPRRSDPRLDLCQKQMRAATGLSEGIAGDGGYLVQKDFSSEILKRTYDAAVLAPKCRKIGISSNANGIKINAIAESSRVEGSRLGGVRAYWENEADLYLASAPKFRQIELVLKKLTGLCYATEEVLADAGVLGGIIGDGFRDEFAFKLDDSILRGTGAGQPKGILNSNALVTVAKESGPQTATTIVLNNIVKMRSRLWSRSRGNSVWFINQDCEPQLNILSLTVGNNSYPVLMPASGVAGAPYDTIFGRPVIPIEQAATLGTVGDIMLLDLSQYLLCDKGSIQAAQSVHVRFLYDEMAFKFTYRVDGQPVWDLPLTPAQGSNTQSPFVVVETRS